MQYEESDMDLNTAIIRISLFFIPGLIWATIDENHASKKNTSELRFILNVFIFGVTTYAILYILYFISNMPFGIPVANNPSDNISDLEDSIDEIISAIALAFFLSIIWVYAKNYKIFIRFLRKIKASKSYGDDDVWKYLMSSDFPETEYINLRDFDRQIVYTGYVKAYSEKEGIRELYLRDVKVYDFSANFIFETPNIYLARKPDDIHLEFPYNPGSNV